MNYSSWRLLRSVPVRVLLQALNAQCNDDKYRVTPQLLSSQPPSRYPQIDFPIGRGQVWNGHLLVRLAQILELLEWSVLLA
jgi:hypothetical protein